MHVITENPAAENCGAPKIDLAGALIDSDTTELRFTIQDLSEEPEDGDSPISTVHDSYGEESDANTDLENPLDGFQIRSGSDGLKLGEVRRKTIRISERQGRGGPVFSNSRCGQVIGAERYTSKASGILKLASPFAQWRLPNSWIVLQSRKAGGEWGTCNVFRIENRLVEGGQMSRGELIALVGTAESKWKLRHPQSDVQIRAPATRSPRTRHAGHSVQVPVQLP
jgi:hypothetical protein